MLFCYISLTDLVMVGIRFNFSRIFVATSAYCAYFNNKSRENQIKSLGKPYFPQQNDLSSTKDHSLLQNLITLFCPAFVENKVIRSIVVGRLWLLRLFRKKNKVKMRLSILNNLTNAEQVRRLRIFRLLWISYANSGRRSSSCFCRRSTILLCI